MLDRLVKDVVIESKTMDLDAFVPLLRERIYSKNPFVKQFLVSWVSTRTDGRTLIVSAKIRLYRKKKNVEYSCLSF